MTIPAAATNPAASSEAARRRSDGHESRAADPRGRKRFVVTSTA
jgi:hypothetical protein